YTLLDKGSHASLGFTHARRALFMGGGTLYMYYARGGDSLNIGAAGEGNAVLIKSAYPWQDTQSGPEALALMQALNLDAAGLPRSVEKLCAGQTLLCRALALKVSEWNAGRFDPTQFYLDDVGTVLPQIIQTTRLGISADRDAHLPWRFVDPAYARYCTLNPLRRGQISSEHYCYVDNAG
ncbi:MAG: DNA-3-methyladenine glycosylase, partial [Burkholderiaceae bacterium]|nr:DNA-3-methyladenine glycosylase [Burkholderiaceae bacterium]